MTPVSHSEKQCFKCHSIKPITEFYKHPRMPDGTVNKCKECNKKDVRTNRKDKRKYYSDYDAKRFKTERRKANIKKTVAKRKLNNPEKEIARRKLGNAVRDGRVIRMPCEICGNVRSQGHHEDYSKPFDVRWLCFKHHREAHGQVVVRE